MGPSSIMLDFEVDSPLRDPSWPPKFPETAYKWLVKTEASKACILTLGKQGNQMEIIS